MSYVLEFTKVALADIEKHKKAGKKQMTHKLTHPKACLAALAALRLKKL